MTGLHISNEAFCFVLTYHLPAVILLVFAVGGNTVILTLAVNIIVFVIQLIQPAIETAIAAASDAARILALSFMCFPP